jgi:hypothetical protein
MPAKMKSICIIVYTLICAISFAQNETPVQHITGGLNMQVASLEYNWDYHLSRRMILMTDKLYQEILESSFLKALQERWEVTAPIDVKVRERYLQKRVPKFNTSGSGTDTTTHFAFVQLTDRTIPDDPCEVNLCSKIDVRYRLIKAGIVIDEKRISFKIMRRNAPLGMIAIKRYSFHPSQFKLLCDTIAYTIFNDETKNEREIWLNPACEYPPQNIQENEGFRRLRFINGRQSLAVTGEDGFSIIQDSVNVFETGAYKHTIENTVDFLMNTSSKKKRSAYYMADHSFTESHTNYRAYINYVHTRIVGWPPDHPVFKHIYTTESHVITLNGDTVSVFNIRLYAKSYELTRMWDGIDTVTVENATSAVRYQRKYEMEIKGWFDDHTPFVLITSGEGEIKKVLIEGDEVVSFYCNNSPDALMTHRNINERQLKILTLLCLLADKYFEYH